MKKIVCLILILLCSNNNLLAANWIKIANSSTDDKVYLDKTSITKENQYRQVWLKTVVGISSDISLSKIQEAKFLYKFSCQRKKYQVLAGTIYYRDGNIEPVKKTDWAYLVPETFGEAAYDYVCN